MDIAHLIQSRPRAGILLSGVGCHPGRHDEPPRARRGQSPDLEELLTRHPADARQIHDDLRVLGRRARYIHSAITNVRLLGGIDRASR